MAADRPASGRAVLRLNCTDHAKRGPVAASGTRRRRRRRGWRQSLHGFDLVARILSCLRPNLPCRGRLRQAWYV